MRKNTILMSFAAVAFFVSCGNSSQQTSSDDAVATEVTTEQENTNAALGKIEYVETEYEFGTITEGEIEDHDSKFKKARDAPVILSQVSVSCGCTTPDYTKEPVFPRQEFYIKVSFNILCQVFNSLNTESSMSNRHFCLCPFQIRLTLIISKTLFLPTNF